MEVCMFYCLINGIIVECRFMTLVSKTNQDSYAAIVC